MARQEGPANKIIREMLDAPVADVLARLHSEGFTHFTTTKIQKCRHWMKTKENGSKRSPDKPKPGTFTALVVAQPWGMPIAEVLQLGREAGFEVTDAAVRKARQTYRHLFPHAPAAPKRSAPVKTSAKPKGPLASVAAVPSRFDTQAGAHLPGRNEMVAVVLRVGMTTAEAVMQEMRELQAYLTAGSAS